MKPIVISGGQYPDNWKAIQDEKGENFIRFDKAELLIMDWDTGEVIKKVNYVSPKEQRNPSLMFKGCSVLDEKILVVTNSELVIFDKQTFEVNQVISHPSFNDLHSVSQIGNRFFIVNTGLDLLQIVDNNGDIVKEINMAAIPTWDRFSRDIDYRKIGSTKPHETHINHVFSIGKDTYITRLIQKDAINVDNFSMRFDIEVGFPHDGVIYEDRVFFTTTNGNLLIFDINSRELVKHIDLNQELIDSNYKAGGWCRGVLPLSNKRVLIGFTQLRNTKFKEFVSWTKNLGNSPAPSRIIEYDLVLNRVTRELIYPGAMGAAIFSIQSMD